MRVRACARTVLVDGAAREERRDRHALGPAARCEITRRAPPTAAASASAQSRDRVAEGVRRLGGGGGVEGPSIVVAAQPRYSDSLSAAIS